jgi:outer membrane protein assembly factor BamB
MRWQPLVGSLCLLALVVSARAGAQDKDKVSPLEVKWRRPMLLDKSDISGEVWPGRVAKVWVDRALTARGDAALVPAFRPLVIGDHLVLRTYDDVRVLCLAAEKNPGGSKASEIFWVGAPGEGGLVASLDRIPEGRNILTGWLSQVPLPDLAQTIVENGLAGALSHDDQRVYWIDHLTVPQPAQGPGVIKKGKKGKGVVNPEQEPDALRGRLEHSALWAMDLKSGKIAWCAANLGAFKQDPFPHSHFLGVPCPLKDKLYALNENNTGELRLVVLDAGRGTAVSTQLLDTLTTGQRFTGSTRRQAHAAQVLADPSMVVCVPHAGKVFGVEPQGKKIAWTYEYGTVMPAPGGPQQLGFWKDTPAVIHDGKVVFTTADSEEVHCLNLQDGRLLWKKRPPDGLYLAGVLGDKVLVVCNSSCRAMALKDGQDVWNVQAGVPSGVGVFDKHTYLLPVKSGATSKAPEIVYLDAERGQITGASPLKEMPGNLALYRNQIVSVSATTVMALQR